MITPITAQLLFDKLKDIKIGGQICLFTEEKCGELAPVINEINALKAKKNAVILAHTYVSPEIIFGVADFVGDSYALSVDAKNTSADVIVFSAVKFMAETAKILNPDKDVLVPSTLNGCSLADSITGEHVRKLRTQYPDFAFVCYINTTADVKAECDVCVTSSNVYDIVERIPNQNIYFLPDKLMGQNIIVEMKRRGVQKNILLWDGTCYVHEEYDPELIHYMRLEHPDVKVVSHPECSPAILKQSDYVGSTSQMIDYVKNTSANQFFILTECGLTTRLQLEFPEKKLVGSCTMCKYMKSNTLYDILRVLKSPNPEDHIVLNPELQTKARHCIEQMFAYTAAKK